MLPELIERGVTIDFAFIERGLSPFVIFIGRYRESPAAGSDIPAAALTGVLRSMPGLSAKIAGDATPVRKMHHRA